MTEAGDRLPLDTSSRLMRRFTRNASRQDQASHPSNTPKTHIPTTDPPQLANAAAAVDEPPNAGAQKEDDDDDDDDDDDNDEEEGEDVFATPAAGKKQGRKQVKHYKANHRREAIKLILTLRKSLPVTTLDIDAFAVEVVEAIRGGTYSFRDVFTKRRAILAIQDASSRTARSGKSSTPSVIGAPLMGSNNTAGVKSAQKEKFDADAVRRRQERERDDKKRKEEAATAEDEILQKSRTVLNEITHHLEQEGQVWPQDYNRVLAVYTESDKQQSRLLACVHKKIVAMARRSRHSRVGSASVLQDPRL